MFGFYMWYHDFKIILGSINGSFAFEYEVLIEMYINECMIALFNIVTSNILTSLDQINIGFSFIFG